MFVIYFSASVRRTFLQVRTDKQQQLLEKMTTNALLILNVISLEKL